MPLLPLLFADRYDNDRYRKENNNFQWDSFLGIWNHFGSHVGMVHLLPSSFWFEIAYTASSGGIPNSETFCSSRAYVLLAAARRRPAGLLRVRQERGRQDQRGGGHDGLTVLRKLGQSCILDKCRKMVRGIDRDGDGFVNMDDFMAMMTRPRRKPWAPGPASFRARPDVKYAVQIIYPE